MGSLLQVRTLRGHGKLHPPPPAPRAAFRDQGRDREDDPTRDTRDMEGDHEEYHSSGCEAGSQPTHVVQ